MTVNKEGDFPGYFRCWACNQNGSPKRFAELQGQEYVHTDISFAPRPTQQKRGLSAEQLEKQFRRYRNHRNTSVYHELARQLGLSVGILHKLEIGYTGRCFTFPMYDENEALTGFRYRGWKGEKWAEKGSRNGLFIPRIESDKTMPIYVTEGASDCMSALEMGLQAVGRPGNRQCEFMLGEWLAGKDFADVVIFTDRDEPGWAGAIALADYLVSCKSLSVRIIDPPEGYKDLRTWLNEGAMIRQVLDLVASADTHIATQLQRYASGRMIDFKKGVKNAG
ncbi:MAG: hypothetical protein HQ515_05775 [Phycisphaeraceae bacterium]|nr:hypothetical protein [Phycisphaeraceae bacterium]